MTLAGAYTGDSLLLLETPLLAERTSIRLGGRAIAEARLKRPEGAEALPGLAERLGGRLALLGEGSNIIASDEDLPLVLVTLPRAETAEVGLSKALGNLFVVVENYPELKANQNFLELQREISKVEHDLQRARRYYNGTVRNYNILIEQFPSSLIAGMAAHRQREYFDLDNQSERAAPELSF